MSKDYTFGYLDNPYDIVMQQNGITSSSPSTAMTAAIGACTTTVQSMYMYQSSTSAVTQCVIQVNPPASTDLTCGLQYVLYNWTLNSMLNPLLSTYITAIKSVATFVMSTSLACTTNGVTISQKTAYFRNGYICGLITSVYGISCTTASSNYKIYNTYFNSSSIYSGLTASAATTAMSDWSSGYSQGCSATYAYYNIQIYQPIPLYTTTTWVLGTTLSLSSPSFSTSTTLSTVSGSALSYLEIILDLNSFGFSSTLYDMLTISSAEATLLNMTRCAYSVNTSSSSTSSATSTGVFNYTTNADSTYTARFLKISFYNVQYTSSTPSSYRLVVFTSYSADSSSTSFASATNLNVFQRVVIPFLTTMKITTPLTLTYVPTSSVPSTYTWVKTSCYPTYTTASTLRSIGLNQLSCIYAV